MKFNFPSERNEFIMNNLGLVKSRVLALNQEFDEDLFQVGSLGLIEATDKYDQSTGNQFSTYARHRIDGRIKDYKIYDSNIKPSREQMGGYRYIETASIENTIDGTDLSIGETLCACDNIEDDVISRIHMEEFISKLSLKYQIVIRMWMDGVSTKNISQEVDIKRPQIPIIVMRVKNRYKKSVSQ